MRSLASLLRGEALTIGYYRDRSMQRWVDAVMAHEKPDAVLCYSSGVAPFVMSDGVRRHPNARRVMDFVDADSDKWRQYAEAKRGVSRLVYRREAHCLAEFERRIAQQFDASVFVSAAEAAFFRGVAPAAADKIFGVANGVDAAYWKPNRDYANPYPTGERVVAFAGAMDYRANVDAATWFAEAVWPRIRAKQPNARFYIVGSKPTREVQALGEAADITVTGRVEDVRPYLAHAHVVTAPLRIARGIQNKVLEALAMAKPVLATPEAWEGIDEFAGRQGCISRSPEVLATEALRWLALAEPGRVPAARAMVEARYDWAKNLDAYERVLAGAPRHPAATTDRVGMEACA